MANFTDNIICSTIQEFDKKEIKVTDSDREFLRGYSALIELACRSDLGNENEVIALAYAAYGWMPTMLKRLPGKIELSQLKDLVGHLREPSSDVVCLLKRHQSLLRSINGSVIGISKFLHFCAPRKIPIWDKWVAKVFECNQWNQINNEDNFIKYVGVMNQYVDSGRFSVPEWLELECYVTNNSMLRKLELCLFLGGRS
jgi:hypothetical protein